MTDSPLPIRVRFDRGTLTLEAPQKPSLPAGLTSPPWDWDPRIRNWRAPAIAYRELITRLTRANLPFEDLARGYETLELKHLVRRKPHPYQKEALEAWCHHGRRGLVVLPTGAGKTYLAEMAIERVGRSALVVAPTLDLLNQWYDSLSTAFGLEVGIVGGGHYSIAPITVTTYDSAYLHLDRFGDRFGILVFDECHHLPGRAYSQSAQWAIAPFRLGLTATPERPDGEHHILARLIGPIVYQLEIKDLAGLYLADYQVVRLEIEMTEAETARYQQAREQYRRFLFDRRISMAAPDGFRRFISEAARTPEGREAYQAYRTSREVALAASGKLEALERLLVRHSQDRILIFTHENRLAYEVSRRFLIPVISHQTDIKERRELLDGFRRGDFPALATSRVLNEGIDVPDANIGIILSGSSSVREHVQRLGRVLRRREGKEALLYEIVTRRTLEERVSDRRRNHSAYR